MKTLFVLFTLTVLKNAFAAPVSCKVYCQYFDNFSNKCNYQTACEYNNKCMVSRYCEKYDEFEDRCVSEATKTTCHTPNPFAGAPSCSETCQYFDTFENKCLYKTKCNYAENCMTHTRCEQWDNFEQKCYWEEKSIQCN